MKHLLFIHTAGDPRDYVERLRNLGFRSSLIKMSPVDADRLCFDRVFDLDYQEDLDAAMACARRLHGQDPIDGVLSFSESGVIAASMAAAELGLPGNHPRAALRARNKYLMRSVLRQAGIDSPPFHLVRTAGEIVHCLAGMNQPMVLKPLSGSSSYGVIRLNPQDGLDTIDAHLQAVQTYIREYRRKNPQYPFEFWLPEAGRGILAEDVYQPEDTFLLEGFLPGRQVSVDGMVCDGQVSCFGVIEVERIRDTDYFLEYEEWMPTRLGPDVERRIKAVVVRAVHAIGLTRSCFHCELKVDGDRIAVLEIAARRGADNIADFIRRLFAVDIYAENARLAVGEQRLHPEGRCRGAMKMRYFIPATSGRLAGVEGVDEVRADPRVSELVLEFEPGDTVLKPPAGFEFLGYLSVLASSLEEADAVLEELYPRVRFHIAPQAGDPESP